MQKVSLTFWKGFRGKCKSESHFLEGVSWKMQKVSFTFWKGFVENAKSESHFLEGV